MAFVMVSRTALVTMPIMLAVFALLHLKWRSIVIILCVRGCIRAALAWADLAAIARGPPRRSRRDYQLYKERNSRDIDRVAA